MREQPALRICVTPEQDTKGESRTVPEQQKLQTKPGGCEKSVTVKNTTQPMPPPYELTVLGRGSTVGFAERILCDQSYTNPLPQIQGIIQYQSCQACISLHFQVLSNRMLSDSWISNTNDLFS